MSDIPINPAPPVTKTREFASTLGTSIPAGQGTSFHFSWASPLNDAMDSDPATRLNSASAAAAASAPAAYVFMGRGALPLSSGGSLPMFMASNCLCMSLVSIRNFFAVSCFALTWLLQATRSALLPPAGIDTAAQQCGARQLLQRRQMERFRTRCCFFFLTLVRDSLGSRRLGA